MTNTIYFYNTRRQYFDSSSASSSSFGSEHDGPAEEVKVEAASSLYTAIDKASLIQLKQQDDDDNSTTATRTITESVGGEERGKHTFNISGPRYLTSVDWTNANHQRAVAASLVQGVYVLEGDRQQNVQGAHALAPPWWEVFHFQLRDKLVDPDDSSFFGAIFELTTPFCDMRQAPRYVIAFRGTIITRESVLQDMKLNLKVIFNKLHHTTRSDVAKQAVRSIVEASQGSNIWIAGHSLGSAIAILAGKDMARTGIFLEAFLFNPPFPSFRLRYTLAGSLIKTGLDEVRKGSHQRHISDRLPSLFVHPHDHICSEYIDYFERLANHHSLRGRLFSTGGNETKVMYLLPFANLMTNQNRTVNLFEAHRIEQWWERDLILETKQHKY